MGKRFVYFECVGLLSVQWQRVTWELPECYSDYALLTR